jgi:hypothetical protein
LQDFIFSQSDSGIRPEELLPFLGRVPFFSVSKQAAVASVALVRIQTTLLDYLGCCRQCCCDSRIANVWQRLDENFLDFFQREAVIEPGPHVDGEFIRLAQGNHDRHRNQAAGAPVQTGASLDIRKDLINRVGRDRGAEGV